MSSLNQIFSSISSRTIPLKRVVLVSIISVGLGGVITSIDGFSSTRNANKAIAAEASIFIDETGIYRPTKVANIWENFVKPVLIDIIPKPQENDESPENSSDESQILETAQSYVFLRRYKRLLDKAKANRQSGEVGTKVLKEGSVETIQLGTRKEKFRKTTNQITKRLGNLVTMDNTTGKIFPGALLHSKPISNGRLHEFPSILGGQSIQFSISGPNLSRPSATHSGTFSSYMENIAPVINQIISTPVRLKSKYFVSNSLDKALIDAGVMAKYGFFKLDSSFSLKNQKRQSYAVLSLDQVFYSASMNVPPQGGFLPDKLLLKSPELLQSLNKSMNEGLGELTYVRKVDYGRRLFIVLSSEASEEELRAAINVTVKAIKAGGEASFDAQTHKVWNSIEGQMILIGGKYPRGIGSLFSGDPDSFQKAVQAVMAPENVLYSPEEGAVPISFELAYASDNAPFQVYETAEFAGKIPMGSWKRHDISRTITTNGAEGDAAVINQDSEIDTDDWTMVELTSQNLRVAPDKRSMLFTVIWHAKEGEKNKTIRPKTIIRSSKTIRIPLSGEFDKLIGKRPNTGKKQEWYAGAIHSSQPFPDHGYLTDIKVTFDSKGRSDHLHQRLTADLNFSVWLKE